MSDICRDIHCVYKGRHDGYCKIHNPEMIAAREKARGPSEYDRAIAKRESLKAVLDAAKELLRVWDGLDFRDEHIAWKEFYERVAILHTAIEKAEESS